MPRLIIYHFMAVPILLCRQNKLSSADPMFGLPSNANDNEITVHPAHDMNSSYGIEKGACTNSIICSCQINIEISIYLHGIIIVMIYWCIVWVSMSWTYLDR